MLRQTQAGAEDADRDAGRLRFLGNQVDFGSYEALVSRHEAHLEMSIGLEIDGEMRRESAEWLRSLTDDNGTHARPRRGGSSESQYLLNSTFVFSSASNDSLGGGPSHGLKKASFQLTDGAIVLLDWGVRASPDDSNSFRLIMPKAYFDAEFGGLGAYELAHKRIDADSGTVEVGVELRGLLPESVRATVAGLGEPGRQEKLTRRLPLPVDLGTPHEHFRQVLDRIQYLGPLRSPGERFYVAPSEESPLLDSTGAFLPYVLRDRAHEEMQVALPGRGSPEQCSLSRALNAWLHFLRTGEQTSGESPEITIEETKDVLVEIRVRASTGEGLHALADSGFGYSQVLPILLRGLLATSGDTLIVEQPELHLHPGLQIRLASFFVALARSGRQVLLETHSEHLVNAIRVASAEDASGEIAALTAIYFIDAMQHPPQVHELSIATDGTVPDWPAGFFGEALSLAGRLLRAQDTRRESI